MTTALSYKDTLSRIESLTAHNTTLEEELAKRGDARDLAEDDELRCAMKGQGMV